MDIFEKECRKEEHEAKLYYTTCLLAEMLWINYTFSNNEYRGTTGDDVFKLALKKEEYTKEEKKLMIENALKLMQMQHRVKVDISGDAMLKYQNLDFEKK